MIPRSLDDFGSDPDALHIRDNHRSALKIKAGLLRRSYWDIHYLSDEICQRLYSLHGFYQIRFVFFMLRNYIMKLVKKNDCDHEFTEIDDFNILMDLILYQLQQHIYINVFNIS